MTAKTRMVSAISICLVLSFHLIAYSDAAANDDIPWLRKTVFGLFVHDRGPTSDNRESGADPNWEVQFHGPDWKFMKWIGSPFPTVGVTPNFDGGTSVLYGGLTYEFNLSNKFMDEITRGLAKNLFVAAGISLALHNGPLHKNNLDCEKHSDCGFGYRVLPRLSAELGRKFWGNHGVSLFYDHMSHKGILPGENEGIDHIGLRYHFEFRKPRSDADRK